ncbi:MAG: hypothetical protein J6V72_04990 [Kiritimatiellae bacterium]|nr:hypothetical protein [Kiritimatiellia bacterium]
MTAKQLRKILAKLPDDTIVCKTDGENGCANLDTVRYCPQFNILYLEPYWSRSATSNIDMNYSISRPSSRPRLDKFTLAQIRNYAEKGKRIVDEKHDGKTHQIRIILSIWDEYLFGSKLRHSEWLSLVVDDTREWGGKLGVGRQCVVCEFEWESLPMQEGGTKCNARDIDLSSIYAVCDECARMLGFTPKDKVVGVWMDECEVCHQRTPCTNLHHDWEPAKKGGAK